MEISFALSHASFSSLTANMQCPFMKRVSWLVDKLNIGSPARRARGIVFESLHEAPPPLRVALSPLI